MYSLKTGGNSEQVAAQYMFKTDFLVWEFFMSIS